MEINGNVLKVFLPDQINWVEIREQNGEDDDILSNPVKSKNLSNFSEFISRVVVNSSYGKLTEQKAAELPVNNRYSILINSRIHSLGETVEFSYDWREDGGRIYYSQDLRELIFDYSKSPTEEMLVSKPNAIPYYPSFNQLEFELTLASSKLVKYHLFNGVSEAFLAAVPREKQTKNVEILARELQLMVDGNYEKVQNFRMFSVSDMREIRTHMAENDPVFLGTVDLDNTQGTIIPFSVFSIPDFFYGGV